MNKIYFDIGANVGAYAKALLNNNEVEQLICVEANPKVILALKMNLSGTGDKIKIINKAISSEKGYVDFYVCNIDVISTCDLDWKNKSRFSKDVNPDSEWALTDNEWTKISVETISIDDLIKKYGVPVEIKIDVEGYELNAIKSMTKFYDCFLSFEWAEEKLLEMIETIEYLSELGYTEFSIGYDDNYKYRPNENDYMDEQNFIKLLNENCIPDRFEKWGMIYCK